MRVCIEGFLRLAARTSLALALASWMLGAWAGGVHAQPPQAKAKAAQSDGQPSKPAAPKLGLVIDDPHDQRSLGAAITKLLDPGVRLACTSSARQTARRWSFEQHYQQLLQLFRQAVGRKQAA